MSEDQIQPADSLDDRGVDDVLDEGISPPEKPRGVTATGVTQYEQEVGESLEERISHEEPEEPPDYGPMEDDPAPFDQVGNRRAGRLVDPDEGVRDDVDAELVADDVGIDGAGASAEEAAVHIIEP